MRPSNVVISFLVAAASCGLGCSYATVGSGQVGVLWTPDGVSKLPLPEGVWKIGYYDKATTYDTRSQERDEQLEVLAANGLRIVLDASIRYHITPDEVVALERELGPHYYETLLGPTLRSQARRVVGRYQPEEIYSTERELIERQIREGVEHAIEGRHVVLEGVLVRNVRLPDTIQEAINRKLEAEQSALKMRFVIAESQAQAEKALVESKAQAARNRIQAESDADTDRITAESHARTKRIAASALDDYNKMVQLHLTPQVLRLREIEAFAELGSSPSSKVLMLGGGHIPAPLLELK